MSAIPLQLQSHSTDSPESVVLIAPLDRLAVRAEEAAKICGIGLTLWREMQSAGRVPDPVRLGARVVWVVDDLKLWLKNGAPDRERFNAIKSIVRSR